jgi:hypothetical protein
MVVPVIAAAAGTAARGAVLHESKHLAKQQLAKRAAASFGNNAVLNANLGQLPAPQPAPANNDDAFMNRMAAYSQSRPQQQDGQFWSQAAQAEMQEVYQMQLQQQRIQALQQQQEQADTSVVGQMKAAKDKLSTEATAYLWEMASIGSLVEIEGAGLWTMSGSGLLIDGFSAAGTIFSTDGKPLLSKYAPPPFSLKKITTYPQATKAGVGVLLLTAIIPIFLLAIGIVGYVVLSADSVVGTASLLLGPLGTLLTSLISL